MATRLKLNLKREAGGHKWVRLITITSWFYPAALWSHPLPPTPPGLHPVSTQSPPLIGQLLNGSFRWLAIGGKNLPHTGQILRNFTMHRLVTDRKFRLESTENPSKTIDPNINPNNDSKMNPNFIRELPEIDGNLSQISFLIWPITNPKIGPKSNWK